MTDLTTYEPIPPVQQLSFCKCPHTTATFLPEMKPLAPPAQSTGAGSTGTQ